MRFLLALANLRVLLSARSSENDAADLVLRSLDRTLDQRRDNYLKERAQAASQYEICRNASSKQRLVVSAVASSLEQLKGNVEGLAKDSDVLRADVSRLDSEISVLDTHVDAAMKAQQSAYQVMSWRYRSRVAEATSNRDRAVESREAKSRMMIKSLQQRVDKWDEMQKVMAKLDEERRTLADMESKCDHGLQRFEEQQRIHDADAVLIGALAKAFQNKHENSDSMTTEPREEVQFSTYLGAQRLLLDALQSDAGSAFRPELAHAALGALHVEGGQPLPADAPILS